MKYKVNKASGYLKVDRTQRTSSLPPALYAFTPKTYAASRPPELIAGVEAGDLDPLDKGPSGLEVLTALWCLGGKFSTYSQ